MMILNLYFYQIRDNFFSSTIADSPFVLSGIFHLLFYKSRYVI